MATIPTPGRQGGLPDALDDFVSTITQQFDIQETLDRLVHSAVEILPIIGAAIALTVDGTSPRIVAETGESAVGPTRRHGAVPIPLRQGDSQLGVLNLYLDQTGHLDDRDIATAQRFAGIAAGYLLIGRERADFRAADQFRSGALHDALTGLPNRSLLQERLEHASRRAERSGASVALVVADLDGFGALNESYGRRAGDDVLRAVGNRLSRLVRPGDTVARSYGDEFVFVCEDLHHADEAPMLALRVERAFVEPFRVGDLALALTASVGVAYAGPGDDILQQLLIKAHVAAFERKISQDHGGHVVDLRDDSDAAANSTVGSQAVRTS